MNENLLGFPSSKDTAKNHGGVKNSMAIHEGFQEGQRSRTESMTGGFYDDVNYGLTKAQRRRQIRKHLLFGLFEMILVCISIVLIINFSPNIKSFIGKNFNATFKAKVLVWISVYGVLYSILVLRRLVFILQWVYLEEPRYAQTNCNCFTFLVLNSFEFCWFLYGNTFFYNEGGLIDKKDQTLWKVMLCILIYGYINMLLYLLACCGIATIVATFYAGGFLTKKNMQEYNT